MKNFIFSKKVKFLVAFLGLCMYAFVGNAQSFTLSGKVSNDKQEPLVGATVLVKERNKGVTADFSGNYKLSLEAGTYELEVSYVGYTTKKQVVTVAANQKIDFNLSDATNILDEVLVSGVRVKSDAPVTHSNMDKTEIAKRNLGQDIPVLLNYLPSVVTTSDAGAGIGYTGIRVRGSDATRVNVTINGIPYNDSESMGTFWVNIGDFASSVENLQLQRGVGTSTNGAGAFGASLNMLTDAFSQDAYAEIASSTGSYNTFKNTLKFSTGKLNDHFELAGRISKITSDGYIDRAFSDLNSYFLQGSYVDDNTLIKAIMFGGGEETYQAWYGIDATQLAENRRQNPYTYDNEIDHYNQDHFQLLWNEKISSNWSSNLGLHYTWGRGYYEQFKEGEDFSEYGLTPIVIENTTIDTTDLIRRKWLNNDFYGMTFTLDYKQNNTNVTFGGAINEYKGDHYGRVIWAQYASQTSIRHKYYDTYGDKIDGNTYLKANHKFSDRLTAYADLQYRYINYKATGVAANKVDDTFNFFNPKAGLTFTVDENSSIYASYARANREPNRGDYENGNPKPEKLDDYELGWRFAAERIKINANVYFMAYQDQLVLSGGIDPNTGEPLRKNVGESYRSGLEIDAEFDLGAGFSLRPNVALSSNKNVDYKEEWDGALKNFGDTNISFSPEIIAGNFLTYAPKDNLQISLLSKYVGEQFMGNNDSAASKLEDYFINDFNVSYTLNTKKVFKSVTFTALVNNIFNEKYVSNGYYGTWIDDYSVPNEITTYEYAGYYPQATRNFLVGMTLKF
ncbi:MAG: TonB-dependent receptor [Flavicella sp.]